MKTREDIQEMIMNGELPYDPSYPGGAWEYNGRHYNSSGQLLRDISEYNPHSEGYTPFGDE